MNKIENAILEEQKENYNKGISSINLGDCEQEKKKILQLKI